MPFVGFGSCDKCVQPLSDLPEVLAAAQVYQAERLGQRRDMAVRVDERGQQNRAL